MRKNTRAKIVFLDAETGDCGDLDLRRLKALGDVKIFPKTSASQIISRSRQAEIIITNKCPLGAKEFENLPKLKLIAVTATGYNNIHVEAARKQGIAVANVAGYSTASVAAHAFLFILAFAHRFQEHQEAAMRRWKSSSLFAILDYPFSSLSGKTLGIVGYGSIGRRVAKIAQSFGMKVLIAKIPGRKYAVSVKRLSLMQLLEKSDYVCLHSALSAQTHAIINAKSLAKMKKSAFLLNLSRGPLVDESAVAKALLKNKIAGYASDVMVQEPPPLKHPFWNPRLKNKILLTPHIAWASHESRQLLMDEVCLNIEALLKSRKRNRVV